MSRGARRKPITTPTNGTSLSLVETNDRADATEVAELRDAVAELRERIATLTDRPEDSSDTASRLIVAASDAAEQVVASAQSEADRIVEDATAKGIEIIAVARDLAERELAAERARVAAAIADWESNRTAIAESLAALDASMTESHERLTATTRLVVDAVAELGSAAATALGVPSAEATEPVSAAEPHEPGPEPAVEPEPVAVEPEPVAVEPEPEPEPEPVAVEPVAVEPEPEPVAVEPEPEPEPAPKPELVPWAVRVALATDLLADQFGSPTGPDGSKARSGLFGS